MSRKDDFPKNPTLYLLMPYQVTRKYLSKP